MAPGTILGSPAFVPAQAPPALAPVPARRRLRSVPSDPLDRLRQEAALAVDEFFSAGGRGQVSQSDRLVRAGVAEMLAARVDPAHFVRYVCMQSRAASRRVFAPQVFGPRAVAGWLPEFRSRCASWSDAPTYECTRERLREHARRNKLELLPAERGAG